MDSDELFSYLRNMDCDQFYPMEGILAQTEAIGDPALPANEHIAILNWLGAVTRDWEQQFPLDEPLAARLRQLRPLLAALAVTDASFLTPGAHPLHQLLDTIQLHAIGWQERLGRVGSALEKEIGDVVDAALAWFDSPETDLAAIGASLAAKAAKTSARAGKMSRRLVETEQGRAKIAQSKQQAALMLNAALEEYPAPAAVGAFLKGPWYDSAQLVLMKFGKDSVEWEDMSRTTTGLLDSLQNPATREEDQAQRRRYIFDLVSQLPKDLEHWLLSLQHNGEAISDTLAKIALLHSRVLRDQALELEKVSPIPMDHTKQGDHSTDDTLARLQVGQWFILRIDDSAPLRATLVLRLDAEQQLLFANQAGMKVLRTSFTEFAGLLAQGKVILLDTGASFSRCLACSVGLETQEDVDEFTGVAAQRAQRKEEARQKAERERVRLELENAERERAELEYQQRKQEKIEQLQREWEDTERLRQEQEEVERLLREQAEQERQQLVLEQEEANQLQTKWEEVARMYNERVKAEHQQSGREQLTEAETLHKSQDLNLPRGTWLGFRDGDELMLARLAACNHKQDRYTFVDCYGTKMRQHNHKDLLIMMARGTMDILSTKPRFKDEFTRAQQQTEDSSL